MDQALNSQKTPHTSPLRASYGMSFVSILMKNDRVIKGFYCMCNHGAAGGNSEHGYFSFNCTKATLIPHKTVYVITYPWQNLSSSRLMKGVWWSWQHHDSYLIPLHSFATYQSQIWWSMTNIKWNNIIFHHAKWLWYAATYFVWYS